MSLGAGILLVVIGAILAFAVHLQVGWVDLSTVGYILIAAGVVGIIAGIALITHRRTAVTTNRTVIDPATGERIDRQTSDAGEPLV